MFTYFKEILNKWKELKKKEINREGEYLESWAILISKFKCILGVAQPHQHALLSLTNLINTKLKARGNLVTLFNRYLAYIVTFIYTYVYITHTKLPIYKKTPKKKKRDRHLHFGDNKG